ncbi:hypothetical protein C0995_016425, partial [Termitomyces sp. Mi166
LSQNLALIPHTSSIESMKGALETALQLPETVPEYALSKHSPATGTQTKPPPTSAGPIEVEPAPQVSAHPPKAQTQPIPWPAEEPMDIDHPPIAVTPLPQPNLNLDSHPAIPFKEHVLKKEQRKLWDSVQLLERQIEKEEVEVCVMEIEDWRLEGAVRKGEEIGEMKRMLDEV